jgi:lysophospholipase L1-like esterase
MDRLDRRTWNVWPAAAAVLFLALAPVRAEPPGLAVMGDSMSDTYLGRGYASFLNLSWTDQVRMRCKGRLTLHVKAQPGATSSTLLAQKQPEAVAQLIRGGKARYVCLIVGSNDVAWFILQALQGGVWPPDALVETISTNVQKALDVVQAAGPADVVLGNVADSTALPCFEATLAARPELRGQVEHITDEVNRRIEKLAQSRRIPVVDLHGLIRLSRRPLLLGGRRVEHQVFGLDGCHPSTLGSAILANAVLNAFHIGYQLDIQDLRITGRDLRTIAGQAPADEEGIDTTPFVLYQRPPRPAPPPSPPVAPQVAEATARALPPRKKSRTWVFAASALGIVAVLALRFLARRRLRVRTGASAPGGSGG